MDIQACILTKETKDGGDMINTERKKNNLDPIQLHFVDMILADEKQGKYSNKLSCKNTRNFFALERK